MGLKMPDRELTKRELHRLLTEHASGKLYGALEVFGKENVKPSLHDLVLIGLNAKVDGLAQIIIEQGATIKVILRHLELKKKGEHEHR